MANTTKGLRLACVIVPKSSEDRIIGWLGGALKIKLKAAPSDGKANAALLKLLARDLNLKPGAITIATGHTSRRKTLVCEGIGSLERLESIERLEKLENLESLENPER